MQVYYGEWRGMAVAVKVAPPGAELRAATVEEFRREIGTMASLSPHPNLLPLLAARTEAPTLALLTPFCSRGQPSLLSHALRVLHHIICSFAIGESTESLPDQLTL